MKYTVRQTGQGLLSVYYGDEQTELKIRNNGGKWNLYYVLNNQTHEYPFDFAPLIHHPDKLSDKIGEISILTVPVTLKPTDEKMSDQDILKFRNSRAAKFFAEKHGYEYLGWVEEQTTFSIQRGSGDISHTDGGSYQCRKTVLSDSQ